MQNFVYNNDGNVYILVAYFVKVYIYCVGHSHTLWGVNVWKLLIINHQKNEITHYWSQNILTMWGQLPPFLHA